MKHFIAQKHTQTLSGPLWGMNALKLIVTFGFMFSLHAVLATELLLRSLNYA